MWRPHRRVARRTAGSRLRIVSTSAILLVPVLCTLGIFILDRLPLVGASWCVTCTTYNSSANCTAWNLSTALGAALYDGSAPTFDGTTFGLISSPRAVPVFTAVNTASSLSAIGYLLLAPLLVCLALVVCTVRLLWHRCAGSFAEGVFGTCRSVLAVSWIAVTVGTFFYSCEAMTQWRSKLQNGDALCSPLCGSSPSEFGSCQWQVAGAGSSDWHGSGNLSFVGPEMLVGLFLVSLVNVASTALLAACAWREGVAQRLFCPCFRLGESQRAHEIGLGESTISRRSPLEARRLVPERYAGAPESVADKVSQVARDLPPAALREALINAGCPTAVTDFIVMRSRPSDAPFTCTICLDEGGVGSASVTLECREDALPTDSAASLSENVVTSSVENRVASAQTTTPATQAHRFCPPCIAASLLVRRTCPLCRKAVELRGPQCAELPRSGAVSTGDSALAAPRRSLLPPWSLASAEMASRLRPAGTRSDRESLLGRGTVRDPLHYHPSALLGELQSYL